MLDIYYAHSSVTVMPEAPDHLEFAGSLDLEAHRLLAVLFEKGRQAGAGLQYFQDSLLEPAQVEILLRAFLANAHELRGNRQALAAFDVMRGVLEHAVSGGLGLAAFAD